MFLLTCRHLHSTIAILEANFHPDNLEFYENSTYPFLPDNPRIYLNKRCVIIIIIIIHSDKSSVNEKVLKIETHFSHIIRFAKIIPYVRNSFVKYDRKYCQSRSRSIDIENSMRFSYTLVLFNINDTNFNFFFSFFLLLLPAYYSIP